MERFLKRPAPGPTVSSSLIMERFLKRPAPGPTVSLSRNHLIRREVNLQRFVSRNLAQTSANLTANSSVDHATQLLSIIEIFSSDIYNTYKGFNYKKLDATAKFSCNSAQLYTHLAAIGRNLDKISRNFTATFAYWRVAVPQLFQKYTATNFWPCHDISIVTGIFN